MKPDPQKFRVAIPVKPYIRGFINLNYGNPADFTPDPHTNLFFLGLLKKPNTLRDNLYPDEICTYTQEVEVLISGHVFYKYGWELTKTDIVAFGRYFEKKAKFFMRSFVGMYHGVGLPFSESIAKFQKRFGFDEDSWPYESIKKDFYRRGESHIIDFDNEIFQKMEKIILRNLSDYGTICKKVIEYYDNN